MWSYFGITGITYNFLELLGNIWKYFEIFGITWKYWEVVKLFGNIWKYLEMKVEVEVGVHYIRSRITSRFEMKSVIIEIQSQTFRFEIEFSTYYIA